MGFIVIEGLDGSGKSTQVKMLCSYLADKGVKYKYIHFPRTEEGIYGQLVARFLRGEFGQIDDVNPYLVSLIYAGDRKDAASQLMEWMKEGYLLIADRYVCSNIAYQGAKMATNLEKKELAEWINNFEFIYNKIPKPDINVFLDVPRAFTEKNLNSDRVGDERAYLNGKKDIHEADITFQDKVKEIYLWQAANYPGFCIIDCKGNDNGMLTPGEIFEKIIKSVNFIPELKNTSV